MKRIAIAIVLICSFFLFSRPVVASELLDKARSDYDFQLEKYRDEYRAFDLKKTQYQNLETFATLEELVSTAKAMLHRRDEVWYTFLQALRIEILETDGFDNTERADIAGQIEAEQGYIKDHQKLIENATTKEDLLPLAKEFNDKRIELETLSYEGMALVTHAKIKQSINLLTSFNDKIMKAAEVQIRDSTVRTSRIRGLEEMKRIIDLADSELEKVKKERFIFKNAYSPKDTYEKAMEELVTVYTHVVRADKLAQELSKGIEL